MTPVAVPPVEPDRPGDDGLQQERTRLAWRRTGLALVVGSLIVARITLESDAGVLVVPVVLSGVIALWAVVSTLRRGRHSAPSRTDTAFDDMLRDGKIPAALTAATVVLCLAELGILAT